MLILVQTGVHCKWTSDSQWFLLENFDRICKSPSQIYHFALPFCPSSSWLQKCYSTELSHTIRVVKGLPSQWGPCSCTVSLGSEPITISSWVAGAVAVGCMDSDIITLDAITGSQTSLLSGHTDQVRCVTFSPDGRSLVSGSDDKTVKLWDVQTGGVVKTFYGHNDCVYSVSISGDYTMIASGCRDCTICLWDIKTGGCLYTIKQQDIVQCVTFSPMDPQYIISISGGKVWKWDINSQQTTSLYDATSFAFSPDHTQLALCHKEDITVQNFNSGAIIAQYNLADKAIHCCCFSPHGRLIAASAGSTAFVWDITGPDLCLIATFVGHTDDITTLTFSSPSSLISAASDRSVKFWRVDALSENKTLTGSGSAPLISFPMQSVSLQTRAGVAISSDLAGVVKTWDLSTGLLKASYQTPASGYNWIDIQLVGGRQTVVWYKDSQIHIWDIDGNELLWTVDSPSTELKGLRISGDKTKVFCLTKTSIQAWSIDTGEHMGKIELELKGEWYLDPLQMNDSRIWIQLEDLSTQGWDFGTSGSSHTPSFIGSTGRPLLDFISGGTWQTGGLSKIMTSGREVFQLSGKYARPKEVRWDGQYLIAGYDSGELLILDFHNMYSQ